MRRIILMTLTSINCREKKNIKMKIEMERTTREEVAEVEEVEEGAEGGEEVEMEEGAERMVEVLETTIEKEMSLRAMMMKNNMKRRSHKPKDITRRRIFK